MSTEQVIEERTSGQKRSSFRVRVPPGIVKAMGLQSEERFLVCYDPAEPDTITLKRVTTEELLRLLRGE